VEQDAGEWTFLSNHGAALVYLVGQPDSTVRQLSIAVGVTERTAFRLAQDLRDGGYLVAKRVGRTNSYEVDLERTLPDGIVAHRTVRDFLDRLVPPERIRVLPIEHHEDEPGLQSAAATQLERLVTNATALDEQVDA